MLTDEARAEIQRTTSAMIAAYARTLMPQVWSIEEYELTLLAVAEEVRRRATLEAASAGREAFRREVPGDMIGAAAKCSRQNAARRWKRTGSTATGVAEEPEGVLAG